VSAAAPAEGRARRRLAADRLARLVVTGGGLAVVASILGILVFLVVEVVPLQRSARVAPGREIGLAELEPEAVLVDEHRTHAATLGSEGVVRVYALGSGEIVREVRLAAAEPGPAPGPFSEPVPPGRALLAARAQPRDGLLAGSTAQGELWVQPVRFRVGFEGQRRRVEPELPEAVRLELDPARRPLGAVSVRGGAEALTAAAQLADGSLVVLERRLRRNLLSGASEPELRRRTLESPGELRELLLDGEARQLYGATRSGELVWWRLGSSDPAPRRAAGELAAVASLDLLIGDRSLAVGGRDGSLGIWSLVPRPRGEPELTRIHELPPPGGAPLLLAASQRNRTFLVQDAGGGLGLFFSTSARCLWSGTSPLRRASAAAFAPKGDAVLLAGEGRLVELEVQNPHPETTLASLFGRVWYEGAAQPEWVWQSTGGSDDFESKLSLTPLLVGTLKGTFYSLVLAVPLGVLGAMYASQFMHPRLQRLVKPGIELMASLPSVVLGFLAGLWLAPRLEQAFPGLLLCGLAFPLLAVLAGALFHALPRRLRSRLPEGAEVFWFAAVLAVGLAACFRLGGVLEGSLFGGSFPTWLLERSGARYDQRNAVVIGIAMGFAVIPIIFAIAEDAFSNVPRSLAAASRALGASRWQTVVRVILPTASPGIFSAIMVGFGRAVGETMIVLMATGNTPILDWSPFNGFRTLSANIAVEIPEAPLGSTLYRVLFVAALLLFALTFLVNTAAELVRHRLRRRYARL
jgi:phosphate transport system permease protein